MMVLGRYFLVPWHDSNLYSVQRARAKGSEWPTGRHKKRRYHHRNRIMRALRMANGYIYIYIYTHTRSLSNIVHCNTPAQTSVTPEMFGAGLRKLDRSGVFELDELELEHLVSTFDSAGNGTIELDNFMTFCLSIPSLPWRAEKVRR